jgi:hypothetical protein
MSRGGRPELDDDLHEATRLGDCRTACGRKRGQRCEHADPEESRPSQKRNRTRGALRTFEGRGETDHRICRVVEDLVR